MTDEYLRAVTDYLAGEGWESTTNEVADGTYVVAGTRGQGGERERCLAMVLPDPAATVEPKHVKYLLKQAREKGVERVVLTTPGEIREQARRIASEHGVALLAESTVTGSAAGAASGDSPAPPADGTPERAEDSTDLAAGSTDPGPGTTDRRNGRADSRNGDAATGDAEPGRSDGSVEAGQGGSAGDNSVGYGGPTGPTGATGGRRQPPHGEGGRPRPPGQDGQASPESVGPRSDAPANGPGQPTRESGGGPPAQQGRGRGTGSRGRGPNQGRPPDGSGPVGGDGGYEASSAVNDGPLTTRRALLLGGVGAAGLVGYTVLPFGSGNEDESGSGGNGDGGTGGGDGGIGGGDGSGTGGDGNDGTGGGDGGTGGGDAGLGIATQTPTESSRQVTNRLEVVTSTGAELGGKAVGVVRMALRKPPGSGNIDLSETTVQWVDTSGTYTLVHTSVAGDGADARFGTAPIRDANDSHPVLDEPDDRFAAVFDLGTDHVDADDAASGGPTAFGEQLPEGSTVQVQFITRSGATTMEQLAVPESLADAEAVSL